MYLTYGQTMDLQLQQRLEATTRLNEGFAVHFIHYVRDHIQLLLEENHHHVRRFIAERPERQTELENLWATEVARRDGLAIHKMSGPGGPGYAAVNEYIRQCVAVPPRAVFELLEWQSTIADETPRFTPPDAPEPEEAPTDEEIRHNLEAVVWHRLDSKRKQDFLKLRAAEFRRLTPMYMPEIRRLYNQAVLKDEELDAMIKASPVYHVHPDVKLRGKRVREAVNTRGALVELLDERIGDDSSIEEDIMAALAGSRDEDDEQIHVYGLVDPKRDTLYAWGMWGQGGPKAGEKYRDRMAQFLRHGSSGGEMLFDRTEYETMLMEPETRGRMMRAQLLVTDIRNAACAKFGAQRWIYRATKQMLENAGIADPAEGRNMFVFEVLSDLEIRPMRHLTGMINHGGINLYNQVGARRLALNSNAETPSSVRIIDGASYRLHPDYALMGGTIGDIHTRIRRMWNSVRAGFGDTEDDS